MGINDGSVSLDDLEMKQALGRNSDKYSSNCGNNVVKAARIIQETEQRTVLENEVVTYYMYTHGVSPYKNDKYFVDYAYYQNELSNFFYKSLSFLPCFCHENSNKDVKQKKKKVVDNNNNNMSQKGSKRVTVFFG